MRVRVVLFLAAFVALGAFACGGGTRSRAASETTDAPYAAAAQGLCDAITDAARGDARAARATFFDHTHQPLHELAAQAAEHDRVVAARLLEAKQAVEVTLDGDNGDLAGALDQLLAATRDALASIDAASPPCQPAAEDTP